MLYIPNNLERKDRQSTGGGVACYIKQGLQYKRRLDLENETLECMWIELKHAGHAAYLIGVFYRKPSSSVNIFSELEAQLESVCSISNKVIIMGDFNCNMLTQNHLSIKLEELSTLCQLSQVIDCPTRITPHSSTLIDLVFVSNSLGELLSGVHPVGLSDHSLVYVILKSIVPKFTSKTCTFRFFRNFNEEGYLTDLRNCD